MCKHSARRAAMAATACHAPSSTDSEEVAHPTSEDSSDPCNGGGAASWHLSGSRSGSQLSLGMPRPLMQVDTGQLVREHKLSRECNTSHRLQRHRSPTASPAVQSLQPVTCQTSTPLTQQCIAEYASVLLSPPPPGSHCAADVEIRQLVIPPAVVSIS